eukprot:CAMPEP_0202020332 /NCGR_PEP_ID=MMETSP0905-20130828/44257_1 /ASSEMBLY_ACC=CAM_ASM_000554 /TAXON_ID=420261 /ORGANISM="Thalassiosira antarctica, Strain CCMP982" /LENGTH=67 /DNA_ID=CAMNT_0048581899 /DNA_START=252 /DNA_END=455 /DNA_ORIENTATION=-
MDKAELGVNTRVVEGDVGFCHGEVDMPSHVFFGLLREVTARVEAGLFALGVLGPDDHDVEISAEIIG